MGCIQSTLRVSLHSYIACRDFLFLGMCTQFENTIIIFIKLAIRKEQIGSFCTNIQAVLYSKILGKIYGEDLRYYCNITRKTSTLHEDGCTSEKKEPTDDTSKDIYSL
jgi:hypothetical protein